MYLKTQKKTKLRQALKSQLLVSFVTTRKSMVLFKKRHLSPVQYKVKPQNITWSISIWVHWHLKTFSRVANIPTCIIFQVYRSPAGIIWERYERLYLFYFHKIIWLRNQWTLIFRCLLQTRSLCTHSKHEWLKPYTWSINIIILRFIDSHDSSWHIFS